MKFKGNDIRWVWFDLDDTLIDFTTNSRAALAKTFVGAGLRRWFADIDSWTECYERHNHALWDAAARGEITSSFLRTERFRLPLAEAGVADAAAREMSDKLSTMYLDLLADEKELTPGAVDILVAVRNAGARVGILSNGFKIVQGRKISRAGLEKYIDLVVLSDDIDVMKPDVRLYAYAMERAGEPDCSAHLMVGDNLRTDIRGSVAAGWGSIFLQPRHGKPHEAVPEGVISVDSLTEIACLLGI